MEEAKPRIHLDYLDGVRALAAIYVTMYHAKSTVWPDDNLPLGAIRRFVTWSMFGHWSVCIFIVLSGYCLMLPIVKTEAFDLRGGIRGFLKRRARRILPAYYFALLLSLALIWTYLGSPTNTVWDRSLPVSLHTLLTHLTLTHNLFSFKDQLRNDYSTINYALWSVGVEWQIYFAFPLLLMLWRKFGGIWATVFWTAIAYVLVMLLRHSTLIGITPQFYALFGLGALGAALSFSPAQTWEKLRRSVPWAPVSFVMTLMVLLLRNMKNGRVLDLIVGISTMAFLVLLSQPAGTGLRKACSVKPLVAVGAFSYSLYLLHAPCIQLVWQYLVLPMSLSETAKFVLLLAVGLPFCLVSSYLFYLVCEKPFLAKR